MSEQKQETPRVWIRRQITRDGTREFAVVTTDGIGAPYVPESELAEAVEAFRQRAVAAVRAEWINFRQPVSPDTIVKLLQQLPATEQPKEPHHARDRD